MGLRIGVGRPGALDERRRRVRYLAAIAAAATAILYFLIGLEVLKVSEGAADAPPILIFGASAGGAFVLGAVLLIAFDRRILWVLGALLQVGVIVMYVNVSKQRTPPFEIWGITIKVLQLAILAALVYLTVKPPTEEPYRPSPMARR